MTAEPGTGSLGRRLAGAVAFVAFFAAVMLVPAGTIAWPRAWVLLAVFLVIRVWGTIVVSRAQPELLVERSRLIREGQPASDRVLLIGFMATYAMLVAFSGLDARRLKLLGVPPPPVAAAGLLLFAGGSIVVTFVLRENAFASAVVRHQKERGHSVVTTGPYRVVRHPMYAGLAASMLGMALWLGSWAAAAASLIPAGFLAARIPLEERLLRRSLPGYAEYAARVRSRFVPGVW